MDIDIVCLSGIYAITNSVNGKKYIGSAVNLKRRMQKHFSELDRGSHHSSKLQRAWVKHGSQSFAFSVLEYIENKADLVAREQYWIDDAMASTDAGYNVAPTAGSILGVKRTTATLEKMRASGLKYRATDATREKLRVANTGKKASPEKLAKMSALIKSPETLEKLRIAGIGRKLSDDSIAKIIAFHTGKKKSPEAKEKMRQAKLGTKQSPETIAKRAEAMRGRLPSQACRDASILARKGCKMSEEARLKISIAGKGRKQSQETIAKRSASIRETNLRKRMEK